MNRRRFACLLALLGSAVTIAPAAIAQSTYSFTPLAMKSTSGQMNGRGVALSPDGVFSAAEHLGQAAIEKRGSIVTIGALPGSRVNYTHGVTSSGDIAVGQSRWEAFYWTSSTGMISLGMLPGQQWSAALGLSERGDVVIGYGGLASGADLEGFVWSPATGMQGMGFLAGHNNSVGVAISGNGNVATGSSWSSNGSPETAVRWESGQLLSLGTLPGYISSSGFGVSRRGDFIVGAVWQANLVGEGFLWSKSTGMIGIGAIPGYRDSTLRDVSEDGTRSIGVARSYANYAAILYDSNIGTPVLLKDYLLAKGVTSVQSWELWDATAISDDGTTIAGVGINPRGRMQFWQATLP